MELNVFCVIIFWSLYVLKIYMAILHMKFFIWGLLPNSLVREESVGIQMKQLVEAGLMGVLYTMLLTFVSMLSINYINKTSVDSY